MKAVTIETVKVGDRVWSILSGWGTVININKSEDSPIDVKFDKSGITYGYLENGKFDAEHTNPELYWNEIKFEAPEKPKRKVKKEADVFVNVYNPCSGSIDLGGGLGAVVHVTKHSAILNTSHGIVAQAIPAKLIFEIEE